MPSSDYKFEQDVEENKKISCHKPVQVDILIEYFTIISYHYEGPPYENLLVSGGI